MSNLPVATGRSRCGILILSFLFVACAQTPSPSARLVVTVVGEDGRPTPSFIAFQDTESGTWVRVPQPFLANEQRDKRSRRPQWRRKRPIHMNGVVEVRLPPGRYRVQAGKGPEFVPAEDVVQLSEGTTARVTLRLERFVDMPARGWWSGDTHVHITRNRREDNDIVRWAAQAEDIHVASLLEMGDIETVVWPQYAWSDAGTVRDGDYWLSVGQEDPRTNEIGHAVVLSIPELIRDTGAYYLYDQVFRRAREVGGLTGLAHYRQGKFKSERSGDVLFPRGLVDFIELLDNSNRLRTQSYYDLLNLGFRPAVAAGSDYPWGSHIGDQRVYAYVDPDETFHPRRWYEAIRQGRTFVTQGPMLDMQVDGRPIGSVLRVARGAIVEIEAEASSVPGVGAPSEIEIVVMGEVEAVARAARPTIAPLRVDKALQVNRSVWIVARARAHNGAIAHTSATYVVVDDAPVVAHGPALEWALERATDRLESVRPAAFIGDADQRRAFQAQVDEALAFYRRLPFRPVAGRSSD